MLILEEVASYLRSVFAFAIDHKGKSFRVRESYEAIITKSNMVC